MNQLELSPPLLRVKLRYGGSGPLKVPAVDGRTWGWGGDFPSGTKNGFERREERTEPLVACRVLPQPGSFALIALSIGIGGPAACCLAPPRPRLKWQIKLGGGLGQLNRQSAIALGKVSGQKPKGCSGQPLLRLRPPAPASRTSRTTIQEPVQLD
jgi:hypothetical protein